MKSIANQYRDLKEGKMSQFNFMRNLRMSMPQFVTNTTSFKDAVRILKNKSILTEISYNPGLEPSGREDQSGMERSDDFQSAIERDLEHYEKYNPDYKGIESFFQNLDSEMYMDAETPDEAVDIILNLFNNKMRESYSGPSIDKMSREEMIDFLGTTASIVKDLTDDELRDIVRDQNADLNEYYDGPSEPMGNENLGDYYEAVGEELEALAMSKYNLDSTEIEQMFESEWHSGKNDMAIERYYKEGDDPSVVAERILEDYMQMEDDIANQIDRMEDEESGKYTKFDDFEGGLGEDLKTVKEPNPNADKFRIMSIDGKQVIAKDFFDSMEAAQEYARKNIRTSHKIVKLPAERSVYKKIEEGKKKKAKKEEKPYNPNAIHPSELRMGLRVEMEHTDDPKKAQKIALDHLAENPFYYTALKLSGIESPSAPKAKPVAPKKVKKKDATEMVDQANQMQKVKLMKEALEKLIRAELRKH
jgi:hypothetical protein